MAFYGQRSTGRELAIERDTYAELCDVALDFLAGGEAQLVHVKRHLLRRLGQFEADTPVSPAVNFESAPETVDTQAGRVIRHELTELVTFETTRSVVQDLAVLYSADDLRRVYHVGELELESVGDILGEYHEAGGLDARLQQIDGHVVLLQTTCSLVRWCEPRGTITYDVLPPHWVRVLPCEQYPRDPDLAYAVAYSERADDETWRVFVRPPFDADPETAITWQAGAEGAMLRIRAADPWKVIAQKPEKLMRDERIVEWAPNPWVAIGGMNDRQLVWHPIVFHWAAPPTDGIFLPPATSLVRVALEMDIAWSLLLRLANTQSHGVPVFIGSGSPPKMLGPSTLVQIDDPNGKFFFAAPTAALEPYARTIMALFQTYALLSKMAPDSYQLTRPSINTGPAKLLEQYGLTERRWSRTTTADEWERARYRRERLLHNAYSGGPEIPPQVRLTVHWGELRVPVDRAAQVQRISQEMAMRVSSRLDAIMEIYGLDRAAAESKLREIDSEEPNLPGVGDPKPILESDGEA